MTRFFKDDLYEGTEESILEYFKHPENRWVAFLNRVIDETDPEYLKKMVMSLGYEAFLSGTRQIRKNRQKYDCNIPWLILFDPTMACNLHCKGCWSGTYGHKCAMSYEDMDKIVSQGSDLGVHIYMLTGGEPTIRMDDIFKLASEHQDCFFALYTNSTLITDEIAERVRELGNITFLISIEGTEKTNDERRGEGHYAAAMKAMDILREHGIIFGTSVCYTRDNVEAVTSDSFFKMLEDKGARFGFYFHFMPVGNNTFPEIMPTVEQRKYMIHRIREVRGAKMVLASFQWTSKMMVSPLEAA